MNDLRPKALYVYPTMETRQFVEELAKKHKLPISQTVNAVLNEYKIMTKKKDRPLKKLYK